MKSFSSCLTQVLYKSIIALVIYSFLPIWSRSDLLQDGGDISHHQSHRINPNSLSIDPQEGPPFSGNSLPNQHHSMSPNYLVFMLVAMALDKMVKMIFQFLKSPKEDRGYAFQVLKTSLDGSNMKHRIIRTVVIYTVLYCFFQILLESFSTLFCSGVVANSWICIKKSELVKAGQDDHQDRLLEELEPINYEYQQYQEDSLGGKISLSLGKVLSPLNLQVNHIVVTKDLKYAFAVGGANRALKVIDISNLEAPNVVKTVSLSTDPYFARQKFMYLSPDEKILFVSCFEELEILDITNPESANKLAFVRDYNFRKELGKFVKSRLSISFALSVDSKTLFIGGFGLQTFDISDLKYPVLLNSQVNTPKNESYSPLSVTTTADRKTLWVANGTLDSYDISDARNMKLIKSFSDAEISMNSIILSRDNKTAFGLGTIGTEKIQIAKLDISNPVSPVKIQSFAVAQGSSHPAFILSLLQKDRYLFIAADKTGSDEHLIVFDLIEKRIMSNDQSLLANMMTVTTLSRENSLIASGLEKTIIVEFYKGFPNREIFSLTGYPTWTREMTNQFNSIGFSQSEKQLFVLGYKESSSKSLFEIYDFQSKTSRDFLASFEVNSTALSFFLSKDERRVGFVNDSNILFWDISNITVPSSYSEYKVVEGRAQIEDAAFWSESNIVFLIIQIYKVGQNSEELRVIDLSDPKSPLNLFNLSLTSREDQFYKMAFSQNKTLFFLAGPLLRIYNSSDVRNLHEIGSKNLTTEETEIVDFVQVSHDDKTIFIETIDRSSFHKLKVYDISNPRNPKLTGELILPMLRKNFLTIFPMLSGDSKTLYLLQKQDILAIDVSNRRAPRIFGLLPMGDISKKGIVQVKLSRDDRTIYLVTKNGTMHSISLQIPQTLFLNQEEFYIGQKYLDSPLVLKLDEGSEYILMESSNYKIVKMGLFEVKVDATAEAAKPNLKPLPSWASFDQESKVLTIEPRKQDNLGNYTLFAAISDKVSASAFSFLDPPNTTIRSTQLISELILRGYLDRQHFLTSEIGSLEDISKSYSPGEREQIFRILSGYYVVTCTTINILPSLRVIKETNQLSISSPNANFIKITIQLQNTTYAKFLRRSYGSLLPLISNNKSHLVIEGPLKEVNTALRSIAIDLENLETCDAEITVRDDMNPSVTVGLRDIKRFFRINQAPYVNEKPKKSVQRQVGAVPVYTGQYFTITLDSDTILDENSDGLNYKLISKGGEANDTIPSWLTFEGLTMKGTAPEALFDRDIEFTLVASNEFKKVEVPFRLHLKISSTFVAKLLMRYSPYILTILGLYIKANKIYNILGKKNYRHKKDFYVGIGEEITNEVIFPIAFIQEETKESEIIWKYLKKREVRNLLDESTSKEKVLKLIRDTVKNHVPRGQKQKLKVYFHGVDSRKKIINQLLINKLIYLQLNLKEEKATKRAFEKVKDKWSELIRWDSSSKYFKTDMERLNEVLTETGDSVIEENLLSSLKKQGVNLSLLSDALEAYAFDHHSINRLAIRSSVQLKEKTERNCLQSFFKFDIENINHNCQLQTVYGISWKFENDSLVFTGVPCENFKKRTLVIEIANAQQKILKEIRIHEKSISRGIWNENTVNTEIEEQDYEAL